MDSITILTSTVVAAIVTALISTVKSFMDSRAKSNDSVRLFRYTKLYEIMHELTNANAMIDEEKLVTVLSIRRQNLRKASRMARPLIDKKYWADVDNIIKFNGEILVKLIETPFDNILADSFNKHVDVMETSFNMVVETQMKVLLKSR